MHEKAAYAFDQEMDEVLASVKVAHLDFPTDTSPTSADIHVVKHLSEEEVPLDRIRVAQQDHTAENVASYFYVAPQMLGVEGDAHARLQRTVLRIAEDKTYRDSVSVDYIYERAVDWLQARAARRSDTSSKFTEYLGPLAEAVVREQDAWFPIPVLRVDCEFMIGHVTFRRISKQMMDEFAGTTRANLSPEQMFAFNEQRSRFQGAAAACVRIRAEPIRARQLALELIEPALAMLRLACPVMLSVYQWAPLHQDLFEHAHSATMLRVEGGRIIGIDDGVHTRMLGQWLITPDELAEQTRRVWRFANALLLAERSDFQTHLLNALLQYSKSVLTPDRSERLLYIISALESIFIITNAAEGIGHNLRERMAILKGPPAEQRIAFMRMFAQVYEYRSAFVHRGAATTDLPLLEEFFVEAWSTFLFLLNNHDKWRAKADFINALERHKLSAPIFTTRGMPAV